MIEQLPEVQKLTPIQKYQLALELWNEVGEDPAAVEPDPAILSLLNERYGKFVSGEDAGISWEEFKRRIGKAE